MGKFICLCGDTFKTKKISALHVDIRENDVDGWKHKVFKQHWQVRFAAWFFSYQWSRFMRFFGAYLIYFVLISHFNIDWTWWEAGLIGIGLGLYIE